MNLERFGFTSTESRVYLALLKVSPATGYVVAREAGLARANTYGALDSLASRGIAARLPGRPARYVATDPITVTGRLDREWRRDLEALTQELAAAERHSWRDAAAPLYEMLQGPQAVLDRAVGCARRSHEELLGVVGPWAADIFQDLARPRGARAVRILSLGSPAPDGAQVRSVSTQEILGYWGGLPLALVSDRRLSVLALFTGGGSASGVVTEHPAVVPFIRHLLRRELAATIQERVA